MKKDITFTAPAGPYNSPHTFKIKLENYAKNIIVFAELIEGEWSIGETSYAISNFVEKEYGLKADSFVLIFTLNETMEIFEIIANEKSQLGLKHTSEYLSSYKMVNTEELKIFLNEQKIK